MRRRCVAVLILGMILVVSEFPVYGGEKSFRSVDVLKREGLKRCAARHLAITEFVHEIDDFAYFNQWHRTEPDKHVVTTLTTKTYDDGTAVAFMATVPTVQGGCDVTFTQLFYAKESCGKVRDTTLKEWKYYSDIAGRSMYEDPTTPSVMATLLPLDTACLIVKTGTLFYPAPKAAVDDTRR